MKSTTYVLILTLFCLCTGQAFAIKDGNELETDCKQLIKILDEDSSHDNVQAARCLGYVEGLNDMQQDSALRYGYISKDRNPAMNISKYSLYCLPADTNFSQMIKVILKYLNDHPEELNLPPDTLMIKALMHYFPCQ